MPADALPHWDFLAPALLSGVCTCLVFSERMWIPITVCNFMQAGYLSPKLGSGFLRPPAGGDSWKLEQCEVDVKPLVDMLITRLGDDAVNFGR